MSTREANPLARSRIRVPTESGFAASSSKVRGEASDATMLSMLGATSPIKCSSDDTASSSGSPPAASVPKKRTITLPAYIPAPPGSGRLRRQGSIDAGRIPAPPGSGRLRRQGSIDAGRVPAPPGSSRRRQGSIDSTGRVRSSSSYSAGVPSADGKAKKMTAAETRRAYSLSLKQRMTNNNNVAESPASLSSSGYMRRSQRAGSESLAMASAAALASMPKSLGKSLPPRGSQHRRDSIESASSFGSVSSLNSAVSSVSARSTTSSRLQRVRSPNSMTSSASMSTSASASTAASAAPPRIPSSIVPPKAAVMEQLRLAKSEDIAVDRSLLLELKKQVAMTEQGVQDLLRPSSTSSMMTLQARQEEQRRLKTGIKNLSKHNEALMLAIEAMLRQMADGDEQLGEMRRRNDQLLRELEIAERRSHSKSLQSGEEEPSAEPSVDISKHLAGNSPLSAYLNEMLRKATEKIEDKWKARFAEQVEEHDRALALERERASETVVSNSRLVTETKQVKDDELKAAREENIALSLQCKHLEIELAAAHKDLDFIKHELMEQDDSRSTSASFWQKTTDLAKRNRNLTEELTLTQQSVKQLQEVLKDVRAQNTLLRAENHQRVHTTNELETEKQVLQDKLVVVEAKFGDEKTRREQFQVNVEQLTVENTALYAQMVALQATHEAKMDELRASLEKRNHMLTGEMRVLQTQNKLMRQTNESVGSAPGVLMSPIDDMGINERFQQLTDELIAVREELVERADLIAELEKKVAVGEMIRRKLHNTIQELRGNIRVHVRLRPFLPSDGEEAMVENPMAALACDTFGSTISSAGDRPHTFGFDKVYGQSGSQDEVFEDVSEFVQSALDGYNVCIFAYGQTGSGKTHTMQGSGKLQMRGIIPRATELIISTCKNLSDQGWQYTMDVTFFEIYNECIRDLLSADNGDDRKYQIRTDKRGKNYVEGLTTVAIDFAIAEEQLEEIIQIAACNRSVNKTDMNEHSSRSHSIFGLTIRGYNAAQDTEMEGSLSLVDLAGSERVGRSNAVGERLKEAQAINKSLSALADVFQALAKKSSHVPYRNSKLTYALQPALSGDGKTLMMVNLSPTFASIDESICSLRFAQNVSQCELGAPTRQLKARSSSVTSANNAAAQFLPGNSVRSSPARGAQTAAQMASKRHSLTPAITRKLLL